MGGDINPHRIGGRFGATPNVILKSGGRGNFYPKLVSNPFYKREEIRDPPQDANLYVNIVVTISRLGDYRFQESDMRHLPSGAEWRDFICACYPLVSKRHF